MTAIGRKEKVNMNQGHNPYSMKKLAGITEKLLRNKLNQIAPNLDPKHMKALNLLAVGITNEFTRGVKPK